MISDSDLVFKVNKQYTFQFNQHSKVTSQHNQYYQLINTIKQHANINHFILIGSAGNFTYRSGSFINFWRKKNT